MSNSPPPDAAEPGLYEQLLAAAAGMLPPPRPPRPSAAVVPWRRRSDGKLEVYWVRRSEAVPFMPGWQAFPGGAVAKGDTELPVTGAVDGTFETVAAASPAPLESDQAGPDLAPGVVAAALRELWEETGVLPLRRVNAATATLAPVLDVKRDAGTSALVTALRRGGLALDAAALVWAGRWLTPPFAPLRFDNRFFLLHWPADRAVQPSVVPGELAAGEWIEPIAALARWREGEVLAAPPILHLLTVLATDGPEGGLARLRAPVEADLGPMRRIEFRPGVVMVPLLTPTLPPATHTNAYLLGTGPAVLVDPGSPFPAEQEKLLAVVAAAAQQLRRKVKAIWLTHHHPDHLGGAMAAARALRVPIAAHPAAAERARKQGVNVTATLADRALHDLGAGFRVRVFHTPGHARGHLAFHVEDDRTLLCGDLLSALSTIVIDPPEGSMGDYLGSLERMRGLGPRFLFPAHGPVLRNGERVLAQLLAHRRAREVRVLAAWRRGLRDPAAIVPYAYDADEVPLLMQPVAVRQVIAHIDHLREQGQI